MSASIETWKSYAQLLARLSPGISHILFANADGVSWWSSDPSDASRARHALALLMGSHPIRPSEVDGLVAAEDGAESRYGFRIRGALGELLGFAVFSLPTPKRHFDLGAGPGLIKPALDCLQSELSARAAHAAAHAAIGELKENLEDSTRELDLFQRLSETGAADGLGALGKIPSLAIEHLSGAVAAILLPDRNVTICRRRSGQPYGIEGEVLAQMHRHLM